MSKPFSPWLSSVSKRADNDSLVRVNLRFDSVPNLSSYKALLDAACILPTVVLVDDHNRLLEVRHYTELLDETRLIPHVNR